MNPIAKTLDQHKQVNRSIQATVGKMADIYRDARERLNAKLQKHVLSGRDPLEGKQLVKLIEDLSNAYGKLEEAFRKEFDRAIPYVAEGYYFDALKDLGKTVLGKPDTAKIDLMKRDAFAHVAGMTQNMLKTDVAFIRQASAEVFRVASATGITREEATQALLAKILGRPEGFKFVDAGGRTWSNQAYCEMLSRTVLLNAGRQTYFDTCAENGEDVVRVTVSGNPCPACAVWENRLLSISGATEGLPTVEQATAAGLCHPNCTHSFVAVGEFARSEDFTEDGRPKTGVNSPGKEEKNDPEAWKKYRQGPAKPAAKPAAKTAKPVNSTKTEQPELDFSPRVAEPSFVPAETVDAARKYMREQIADKIDLPASTPLPVWNAANELIGRNLRELGFDRFHVIRKPRSRNAIASMTIDNTTFGLNPSYWREIIEHPERMFDMNVTLPAQRDGVRFLAVDRQKNFLRHVVDHEFGHAVFNRSKLPGKAQQLNELFNQAKQSGDLERISGYAATAPGEFFAEIFAMFHRGDTLPSYMREFITEVMK